MATDGHASVWAGVIDEPSGICSIETRIGICVTWTGKVRTMAIQRAFLPVYAFFWPKRDHGDDLLRRAWQEFCCRSLAESIAFNLDCLGCIAWFEYAEISNYPGKTDPVDPQTALFVRFFHQRRDVLRDANVVADVAVFRSFPSPQYSGLRSAASSPATWNRR